MPPKKVVIDPETTYRSGALLRQKKFPDRKGHVKQRRSLPATIKKEQSTLTQRWSFESTSSAVGLEDDEIENSQDEDYGPKRPKRKRRKTLSTLKKEDNGRTPSQNTMTQMGFVTSFDSHSEDEGGEHEVAAEDEDDRVPESVSSQQETMRARTGTGSEPVVTEDEQEDAVTRSTKGPSPELPLPAAQPRTPQKHFPLEIPSSNTPQSIMVYSTFSKRGQPSLSKSPLKDRNRSITLSPAKMTFGPFEESPINETPAKHQLDFSPYSARKTDLFRRPEFPASRAVKPPALQHRSTIPDSEDTPVEETSPPRYYARPMRKLQRMGSTVEETQQEGLGQDISEDMENDSEQDNHEHAYHEYQATMDCSVPYYDTVMSALDRDASRYMQTQRLKDVQRAIRPDIVLDTQEGSSKDLLARYQSFENAGPSSVTGNHQELQRKEGLGDDTSIRSQSLPNTPEKSQRPRHRPRFHDVEVVDLTAESFEPVILTLSGSPTPKPKIASQHNLDVHQIMSSPSSRRLNGFSSSPPLLPRHDMVNDKNENVEILPLNDIEGATVDARTSSQLREESNIHGGDNVHAADPSQVSTVGHSTQALRSQRRRPQIKREHDSIYSSPPNILKQVSKEMDLDLQDDDVEVDESSTYRGGLGTRGIQHVQLSGKRVSDDDGDEEYVDIDDIHHRYHIGEHEPREPSSPVPAPPGHVTEEYEVTSHDEISSDMAFQIPSPPSDSSPVRAAVSPDSHTSPETHAHQANEAEVTPRAPLALQNSVVYDVSNAFAKEEITSCFRPALSEKAKGKRPLYQIQDSEDDDDNDDDDTYGDIFEEDAGPDLPDNSVHVQDENNEQQSWYFRPANEILPDTQYSVSIPPIPSSDDFSQRQGNARRAEAATGLGGQRTAADRAKKRGVEMESMEDVSLAAPPKSSFGWKKSWH